MKLFFPTIGTQLRLTEDCTVQVFEEYRNETLFAALGYKERKDRRFALPFHHDDGTGYDNICLPTDTVLQIDRIFLRKSMADWDSITFVVVDSPDRRLLPWKRLQSAVISSGLVRFWVQLDQINNKMDAEIVKDVVFGYEPSNKTLHVFDLHIK